MSDKRATPLTDELRNFKWVPGEHWGTQMDAHYAAMTELSRRLERDRAELMEALEKILLAVNIRTGLESDQAGYERVKDEHGEGIANAWFEARATLNRMKGES